MIMIKTGIVGGAGYTGGELLRILLRHPQCEISFILSRSQKGRLVSDIHPDLIGETDLSFSSEINEKTDIVFLCMGHNESKKFLNEIKIPNHIKIIDLSQDFRLSSPDNYPFVYGLPEINRLQIMNAQYIANPGCFATAIQLALLPLAVKNLLSSDVHVSAITGSTGAGQKLTATTHFTWRSSNISLYKAFRHQHLAEITKTLMFLQKGFEPSIRFLPFRGNFTRGILATVYTKINMSLEEARQLFNDYYQPHPFVFISEKNPDLKQVVNTNKSVLYLEKHKSDLLVVCVIDNLVKGAAGQAIQNMNLMFGLEETCGLSLKPVAF
jgi:N-acetyl-gamma-glutamyl-phosphate reductase